MEDFFGILIWFFIWEIFYFTGWILIKIVTFGMISLGPRKSKIWKRPRGGADYPDGSLINQLPIFLVGCIFWVTVFALLIDE